jgi:hypothetical protein
MVEASLEAQRWRRTAGAWTVWESQAEPSQPLDTRLPTISSYTAYVFWLVKMTQSGAYERWPDLRHQG